MNGRTAVSLLPATTAGLVSGAAQATWTKVTMFDTPAWLAHQVDLDERDRRQEVGMGAVQALDLLDILMNLPAGMPVPLRSLGRDTRQAFGRMPRGAVDLSDTAAVRRVVPLAYPSLAVVISSRWHDGLVRASRFAAYCQRMTLLRTMPDDARAAMDLATRYGIGLAVLGETDIDVLVEPQPLADWQPTPAWWWFSETIFHHMRR
ncbi:MAG: hypothetical protein M3548_10910 [Actinomycetota bacterium]|nr:hypothetical protein [Actinomycetota bacterium]